MSRYLAFETCTRCGGESRPSFDVTIVVKAGARGTVDDGVRLDADGHPLATTTEPASTWCTSCYAALCVFVAAAAPPLKPPAPHVHRTLRFNSGALRCDGCGAVVIPRFFDDAGREISPVCEDEGAYAVLNDQNRYLWLCPRAGGVANAIPDLHVHCGACRI